MDSLESAFTVTGLLSVLAILLALISILIASSRNNQSNFHSELLNNLEFRVRELEDALSQRDVKTQAPTLEVRKVLDATSPVTPADNTVAPSPLAAKVSEDSSAGPLAHEAKPVIVTRTNNLDGQTLDTWSGERKWTKAEAERLITLYRSGSNVATMATTLGVDSKDVVYKIARVVYGCTGELEEKSEAAKDGERWTKPDDARLQTYFRAGNSILRIAQRLERTQLAIVWRLTEHGLRR